MSNNGPNEREKLDWEKHKFSTDIASQAHKAETEFFTQTNEASIGNANIALRTLVLINGGAALAFLTFIGNQMS